MKTYAFKRWDGSIETIIGSNKYQEIRYNKDGEPFVRYKNIRIKLDDVMRYEDADLSRFLGCEICGACNDTVYSAYLIHLDTANFQAKVFYSYC